MTKLLKMRLIIVLLLSTVLISCKENKPKVDIVSTIKPIHMLVTAIAGDDLHSVQLIPDSASPHHYSLKPSDIKQLHQAELILRIDEQLESFLNKPLNQIGKQKQIISLMDGEGIELLAIQNNHASGNHHEHDHAELKHDPHIWLDPDNAIEMSKIIAISIIKINPSKEKIYLDRLRQLTERIKQVDQQLQIQLKPASNKAVMVFHNAWGYFEKHYGLNNVTAVNQNPTKQLGATTVKQTRQVIKDKQITCFFTEPQSVPPIVKTLVSDASIPINELHVLGKGFEIHETSYINLLQSIADSFVNC